MYPYVLLHNFCYLTISFLFDRCPLDGEIMGMFQYSSDKQNARVSFPAHKFPYTASVYYTCEVKLCDLNHPTDCVSTT